ncbi:MAG: NADH-quinone oxidoreductase subunit F [Candidatus Omnitrophica bacterium]|nr:NADH-quinone oxidoreductase subunit F [Candidatus Omnitrophota bacterium]
MRLILKKAKTNLKDYLKEGGYQALEKALKLPCKRIIEEVKKSNLSGRGGAGFPTGLKWETVYKEKKFPKYVICNADESEPATFKDRVILEENPHLVLEGIIICAKAIGAKEGFIYLRGEYSHIYQILTKAIEEAKKKNFLGENILKSSFSFRISIFQGAGAYICGEETALINSLEGERGFPLLKPPFPVKEGFREKPTVVNNVETFSNIPFIILKGAKYFSKISKEGGTKLYCVVGDVKKPGIYEFSMDVTLRELLLKVKVNRFKAVLVGGVNGYFLTEEDLDLSLGYKSLKNKGYSLGSGALIVIGKKRCIVDIVERCIEFFEEESCGKCTPCRDGLPQARRILKRIKEGRGRKEDIIFLKHLTEVISTTSFCSLGKSALNSLRSGLDKFSQEFYEHVTDGRCKAKVCF